MIIIKTKNLETIIALILPAPPTIPPISATPVTPESFSLIMCPLEAAALSAVVITLPVSGCPLLMLPVVLETGAIPEVSSDENPAVVRIESPDPVGARRPDVTC